MEATQAAYLAGLIDGEGTLTVVKTTVGAWDLFHARLSVVNTSLGLLHFCLQVTETGSIIAKRVREGHRTSYVWLCGTEHLERVVSEILPYLVLKREQAELILEYRDLWKKTTRVRSREKLKDERARQLEIFERVKELNRRGADATEEEGVVGRVAQIPYRRHLRADPETEAKILEMLQAGEIPVSRIAEIVDVSRTVVRRIAKQHEIERTYISGDRHWMKQKAASGEGARTEVCPWCQKSFDTIHPIQKFCSLECQRKDETTRRAERKRVQRAKDKQP